MVKDAEANAKAEDERSKVEARNQLDQLVYQVEKDSAEWGDKVSAETQQRLGAAMDSAKEAFMGDDADHLNTARDELMQAFSAAGQEMYQAQAAETAAEEDTAETVSRSPQARPMRPPMQRRRGGRRGRLPSRKRK